MLALFLTVFVSSILFDLKSQADALDLNQLEQMESASVILDRNGKIFGQIYVENRETVPYEKLPPDLVNAVVAVEDAKFYEHQAMCARAAAPSRNNWRGTVLRSKKEHIAGSCWRFSWPNALKIISASRKSWSCI